MAALAACALPAQQLALPGPIDPATTTGSIERLNRKPGVGLSGDGGAVGDGRAAKGSGEFTRTTEGSGATTAQASETANRDGVTLNLAGASIAEAAKLVLGDILRVTYVVSDKLKGAITIQTARPIPRAALLDVFESLLRSEGAAIVVENGLHKILPAAEAVSSAPLRGRGNTIRRGPGVGAQIVPLQYVAAAEMERILKSMAPQAQVLRVDSARNLLILAGSRIELESMLDAVATFDVDWMRGMSFAIHPLESADPDAIAVELDTIFANDRDGPTKGIVRFVPNRRLKSILVISSRPEYLDKAERWIRRIDMVGRATEKQVHVYHAQGRSAVELAQLLNRVYGAQERAGQGGQTAAARGATVSVSSATPAADTATRTATPQPPAPQPLGFDPFRGGPQPLPAQPPAGTPGAAPGSQLPADQTAAATDAAARPTGSVSAFPPDDRQSGISVVADEANNSLVITATPAEYKRVRQILERVDLLANQVLIEATIAEVTLTDQLKMGLRWFFKTGNHSLSFSEDGLGTVASQFPGFSNFFSTPNAQIALNALSAITDVNVVSSPSLMVLDNKRAVLQVGDEVPIATQSAVGIGAAGAPIVNSIAFRNTGVILAVTPRITDNGRIVLDIEQEVSDVVGTSSSTIDSPTIQQRRVRTTVVVNDGESVVLGGMIQDRATNKKTQVPILGQLPVIGNLFKHKDDVIKRTELLIAMTPRIVKDGQQMRGIAAEFRDKLNLSTRPQRGGPPDRKEQVDRVLR